MSDLNVFLEAAEGYRLLNHADRPLIAHQVIAAADEIERLRAVLQSIVTTEVRAHGMRVDYATEMAWLRELAREALE